MIDALIFELVVDEGEMFNFAVMIGQYLLQVERSLVVDSAAIEDKLFKGAVLSQSLSQIFQALGAKFIVAEVEFGGRYHVTWAEGVAKVKAACGGDLVDFKFKLFDGFGSFHIFAKGFESFIVGFKVGEDNNLEVFVASLLAEGLEDGLGTLHAYLFPKEELHEGEVTFLRWGVSP